VTARTFPPFFAALTAIGLVSACSRNIVAEESTSPDGKITLRVEDDLSGGAAVADVRSVFLKPVNSSHATGQLIFKGTAIGDFSAKWQNNDTVELSYTNGYVARCESAPLLTTGQRFHVIGCK
jgi:hypothetical protein